MSFSRHVNWVTFVSCAVFCAAYVPGSASAQPAVADEIRVTASRRDTRLHDLPFNITVISGETIERQRLTNLAELSRWAPGLNVIDQGARGADRMIMRGLNVASLNASEFLGNTGGGAVMTYLGDIPLYLDLRMTDLERVEVLLGPQGTLYGAGTLGGAVRYIPARPDVEAFLAQFHSDLFSLTESRGIGLESSAVFNVPIVEGRMAFRASVSYLDSPGFIDYDYLVREAGISNPQPDLSDANDVRANLTRTKDANYEETVSTRLSFLWNASDSVEATIDYYLQDGDVGARTVNHRQAFGTDRYVSAHRFLEPNDRKSELLSVQLRADFGFAELTSSTGISNYREHGQRDQTDLLLDFEIGFETFPSFAAFAQEDASEDTLTQEIRLVSTNSRRFNWIGGFFYRDYELNGLSREFTPGIPEFFAIDRPDNLEYIQVTFETIKEKAFFGEIGYELTDRWQLAFGGRWFEYEDHQSIGFDVPLMNGTPDQILLDIQENFVTDSDSVLKLGSTFDFSADVTGYATISQGYRIGGANSVPPCELPLPAGQNVCALPDEVLILPDTTVNYEAGAHAVLGNGRFNLRAALYHIDWDDIQTMSTTLNGAIPIVVNGGSAVTEGVEVMFGAALSDAWNLDISYANNKAELASDAAGLVDGRVDAFDGDRLAGTPKHQFSLHINHARVLNGGWQMNVSYGLSYTSDISTKVGLRNNGEALGGFGVHSASIGFSRDQWSISVYADNIANTYAETGARLDRSYVRDVNGFALRRYFKNVLTPRTVGVEARYRFAAR